jgi:hypothetical protein
MTAPLRQLDMFARRRPPAYPAKGRSAVEFRTHCMLADTLARWAEPGWWWTHFPAGEKRDPVTGARLKRMGLKPGVSDFLFIGPAGGLAWLELKRGTAPLSDAQVAFRVAMKARGVPHIIARSYGQAVDELKQLGILPRSVHVQ